MPIEPITKALYPLVPQLPGVPPLLRSGAQLFDTITLGFLGVGDALNSIIGTGQQSWGIFDEAGNPAAEWDSFNAVRFRNAATISTYPVEEGGFVTYNKVASPFDIQVVLTCAGSDARISQFLVDLEAMQKTISLYTVVMPEFTFSSVNVVEYDFQRTKDSGSHMIIATLNCQEVRQTAITDFSNNQNPEADSPKSLGQVQTVDAPSFDVTGLA
jgi:hypothetical protein